MKRRSKKMMFCKFNASLFPFSCQNKEELFQAASQCTCQVVTSQLAKLMRDPMCSDSFDEASVRRQRLFFSFSFFFLKGWFKKKPKWVGDFDRKREQHQRRRIAVKVHFEKAQSCEKIIHF